MDRNKPSASTSLTNQAILQIAYDLMRLPDIQSQAAMVSASVKEHLNADCSLELDHLSRAGVRSSSHPQPLAEYPSSESIETCDDEHCSYSLTASLAYGERTLGRMVIHRADPFLEQEKKFFNNLTFLAGLTMGSTHQSQLQDWRDKQLDLVRSVNARISQITEIDLLTRQITELVQETFDYYYVAIFLIDSDSQRLKFKASSGADDSDRPDFERQEHPGFRMGEHMIGYVAQTGQEIIANDVTREPRYQSVDSLADTAAEVVIPLQVENQLLGVFDIQANQTQAFDEDDLLVLRVLADNISIAIESAHLLHEVRYKADQLAAVAEANRAITSILDIDELLNYIVNLIHDRFAFPYVHLYTIDPVQSRIVFRAGSGTRQQQYALMGISYDVHSPVGLIPAAVQNKTTHRVGDVSAEPLYFQVPFFPEPVRSEMTVPFSFGREVLGVLDIQSEQTNAFTIEDQHLVETLADNIAVAIRNANLYRSERWRSQVAESLRDVAGLLSDNTNLEDSLNAIVTEAQRNLPCDFAGIWLFDQAISEPDQNSPIPIRLATYYISDAYSGIDFTQRKFVTDAWIIRSVNQDEPAIREPEDPVGPIAHMLGMQPSYSAIAAPLRTGEEILGFLTLIHASPRRYGVEAKKNISAFSSYAAIAIQNIRLLEKQQEEAYVSTVLLQAAQAVVSNADLPDILNALVHLIPILVGIKSSVIYAWDPDANQFEVTHAILEDTESEKELIGTTYQLGDFPMLDAVYRQNRPYVYPLVDIILPAEDWDLVVLDEDLTDPNPILKSSYPILEGFPLSVRNEVYGVLIAQDKNTSMNRERRFELIMGIAQQASLAIQNDLLNREMFDRQRLEQEFRLAREIQQTFLPTQIPSLPGWDLSVRWETARQVGGDFYDYFLLSDQQLGIVIADVSNKGLAASLYMTVTRTLIRAAAFESDLPARTLEHVNDLLLRDSPNGLFVTAFYGILDLGTGQLTYASAGHNPPLVILADSKRVEPLTKGGIALGALGAIQLEDHTCTLNEGDGLLLYTDGVSEAFNLTDQMYGVSRLKSLLVATVGQTTDHILQAIEDDLVAFRQGAPVSDDTTLLALRRKPLLAD